MKQKFKKCLAVLLILACTFSVNLNVFADEGEVKVTFVTYEGDQNVPAEQTITAGSTVTEPKIADREGYTFNGWYNDAEDSSTAWDFSNVVNSNITLTAHYTEKTTTAQYTVTFDAGDGVTSPDKQVIDSGNTAKDPGAIAKDGYSFDGWYYTDVESKELVQWDFEKPVTSNLDLTAKYSEDPTKQITTLSAMNLKSTSGATTTTTLTSVCDGKTFTVNAIGGEFPNGATLSVKPADQAGFQTTVNKSKNSTFKADWAYEIKIMLNNTEYQPEGGVSVSLSIDNMDIPEGSGQAVVYHVHNGSVEKMDVTTLDTEGKETTATTNVTLSMKMNDFSTIGGGTEGFVGLTTDSSSSDSFSASAVNWDVSKSKTATPLDNKITKVTLSMPSAEEKLSSDVVFVVDYSSCAKESFMKLPGMLDSLYKDGFEGSQGKLNIGVILFRANAATAFDLQEYTGESTNTEIFEAINNTKDTMKLKGSNIPAGLDAARNMLKGSDTPKARKYMILISDGKTYLYTHGNSSDHYSRTAGGKWAPDGGLYEWTAKYDSDPNSSRLPFPSSFQNGGSEDDWNNFLGSIGKVRDGFKQYDQIYERTDEKPIAGLTVPNPAVDINSFEINSEESMYQAATDFNALKEDGVKCYGVNVNDDVKDKEKCPVSDSFMNYLGNSLGFGAYPDFKPINNDIEYLINQGYVSDAIGSAFNLVKDDAKCPFTLTVGGTEQESIMTGDNVWSFGKADANGVYPYTVKYTPGDDEKFEWKINVKVKNSDPLQLSYNLLLTASPSEAGNYKYDTNGITTLDYID
jgi:uncharacterized repeat protein (TIGR02543 family)